MDPKKDVKKVISNILIGFLKIFHPYLVSSASRSIYRSVEVAITDRLSTQPTLLIFLLVVIY